MKTKKRIVGILLVFALMLVMLPGMTLTAYAESTTVTINQNDFSEQSKFTGSFTKDGVTVKARWITPGSGNLEGGGSFSTTLGNFTKIVVTASTCNASGDGWSGDKKSMTWSGTPASTVSFGGAFDGYGQITIVFTIAPPTVDVTGVSLNKDATTLTVGGTETLTATITPDNATDKSVTWTSDNTAVATVDNGVVTAVAPGTATITVTTTDGGKDASCEVTVTKAAPTSPTGLTATFGQTLANVTLPGGWTWADSTQSVGNAGTKTFKANFAGNANYKSASNVDVTVTVAKADPTDPTGLTAIVGETLADVSLPTGWTWADDTQSVGEAGKKTFKATFAGDANYNSAENIDVTVTVSLPVIKVTEGDGSTHEIKKDGDLNFRFLIDNHDSETFDAFNAALNDDSIKDVVTVSGKNYSKTLTNTEYKAESGSLKLTLTKAYLDTLKPGDYTVTVKFKFSGSVYESSSTFKIAPSGGSNPGTGENIMLIGSAMILFILSLSVLTYMAFTDKLFRAKLLAVPAGITSFFSRSDAHRTENDND